LSDVLVFLIVLAILVAVVAVVSAPLRRARAGRDGLDAADVDPVSNQSPAAVQELEAAREAKYREIRDAEMDHETGKLSDQDFEAIDRSLRAEAIEILHALDRVRGL
jgi:hypothetical protein